MRATKQSYFKTTWIIETDLALSGTLPLIGLHHRKVTMQGIGVMLADIDIHKMLTSDPKIEPGPVCILKLSTGTVRVCPDVKFKVMSF